jgi:antitoxin PrlF
MTTVLEAESSLTDRYQTTVPESVRRALKLGKRDRVRYELLADHRVVISRVQPQAALGEDPVLGRFLDLLARDIASQPSRMRAVDSALVARLRNLVKGVDVDLDAPLAVDDE